VPRRCGVGSRVDVNQDPDLDSDSVASTSMGMSIIGSVKHQRRSRCVDGVK